jgi:signal transduction histidine kinase
VNHEKRMTPFQDSQVEKTLWSWVVAALAFAVVLTGFMGFLSWRSGSQATQEADWVGHTRAVEVALAETVKDAVDVETGARGYAATGDEVFLEPYQRGQAAVDVDLGRLRQLTADNPSEQRRLDVLQPQINARNEAAERTVQDRRVSGVVPEKASFLEGKRRMDEVRATITEMQSEEGRLLEQRTSKAQEARHSMGIVNAVSTLTGMVLLLLAGFGIGREITNNTRLHARLNVLNADLETRVEERTAELQAEMAERRKGEQEICRLNAHLEQRVRERTAELEAANKELEAFTYSVSHDLRAPLRHIGAFTKMLVEEHAAAIPPEAQHYLERIQQGTRRMGLLVDDLLNLARIGRQELRLQVTGLDSIARDVIAELGSESAGRIVEWKIGSLPYVEGDPALLKQVLQNLLSNALKYSRPRATAVIEIGQLQHHGSPVIFVRDNGVGFSMKYADKLFGVFQRLHRAEDFEGTGVGLATVQRIIHKHGGRVWAEAELDQGATFYFTLTAATVTAPQPAVATEIGA